MEITRKTINQNKEVKMFKRNYAPYKKETKPAKRNAFVDAATSNITERTARTENGMRSRETSASDVLDFFGKVGSARGVDITSTFMNALAENEDLTIRALLWARDVREGAGERAQFRRLLAALEKVNPALAGSLMHKIPELGRWDDLFAYTDYTNRKAAFDLIRQAIEAGNGLCAKWLPRKGPVAVELTKHFGFTPRQYRKVLVQLSKTVEQNMCANDWDNINFSSVPSLAAARYQKAFYKHSPEAYSKYRQELSKPAAQRDPSVKINAKAVYPYDIVKSVVYGDQAVANAQWDALPDYLNGTSILPMVDVSGSMGSFHYTRKSSVQPIDIAVSLGLYVAGRNKSAFRDLALTFSAVPKFVRLSGSLKNRVDQMDLNIHEMNTNLHAAFDSILTLAERNRVPASDMPEVLLILSDMQFDRCTKWDDTVQEMIERKFYQAGYKMPKIVFWNLREGGGKKDTPVRFDDRGVCLVSGFSPAIMKSVLANNLEGFSPYNVMLQTLQKARYDH